jgi:PEP-CTERM motif
MLSLIMVIVALAGLVGMVPRRALAAPITKIITIAVQGGGTAVVSLTGEDNPTTPNGIIEVLDEDNDGTNDVIELTTLTATWTPGQPTDPTAFTLAIPGLAIPDFSNNNQVQFHYNIGNDEITNLFIQDGNKLDCQPCNTGNSIIIRGPDPDADFFFTISSQGPPPATVIPEPSTWLLLSTGLAGVVGYAFFRRWRSAAPGPASAADATL